MRRKIIACFLVLVLAQVCAIAAPRLRITTRSLPGGTVGVLYSATVAANFGVPPYGLSPSLCRPTVFPVPLVPLFHH